MIIPDYVFVLRLLLSPSSGGRTQPLSSGCKTDKADFTDWVSSLPSNFMEEISPNPEALNANAQSLSSA